MINLQRNRNKSNSKKTVFIGLEGITALNKTKAIKHAIKFKFLSIKLRTSNNSCDG